MCSLVRYENKIIRKLLMEKRNLNQTNENICIEDVKVHIKIDLKKSNTLVLLRLLLRLEEIFLRKFNYKVLSNGYILLYVRLKKKESLQILNTFYNKTYIREVKEIEKIKINVSKGNDLKIVMKNCLKDLIEAKILFKINFNTKLVSKREKEKLLRDYVYNLGWYTNEI